jgi:hypothetical protein
MIFQCILMKRIPIDFTFTNKTSVLILFLNKMIVWMLQPLISIEHVTSSYNILNVFYQRLKTKANSTIVFHRCNLLSHLSMNWHEHRWMLCIAVATASQLTGDQRILPRTRQNPYLNTNINIAFTDSNTIIISFLDHPSWWIRSIAHPIDTRWIFFRSA